jgi:hypothetical protein
MPLRKGELAAHGHWTVALAYYRRDDVEALRDVNGDAVIAGFLAPAVEALRAQGLLSDYNWIRYSENGFHIRCRFRAADEATGTAQQAVVAAVFEQLKAQRPELFAGHGELSQIALSLNRKLDGFAVREPGTLELGPVHDANEDCVYDSWEAYRYSMQLQTRLAQLCLDALQLGLPYHRLLALAQVCGYDLLGVLTPSRRRFADIAAFVCATWRDFFGISAAEGEIEVEHIWKRRAAFYRLFDTKNGVAGSLVAVPEALHGSYRALFDWLAAQDRAPLWTQADALFAMQALSLFHQQFNRLGISINDETAYADLLHDYACRDLDADDGARIAPQVAALVRYWSANRVEA